MSSSLLTIIITLKSFFCDARLNLLAGSSMSVKKWKVVKLLNQLVVSAFLKNSLALFGVLAVIDNDIFEML